MSALILLFKPSIHPLFELYQRLECSAQAGASVSYFGRNLGLRRVLEQTDQHLALVQDGARYHTSAGMRNFFEQHADRLPVFQLPSYSPDYNPIEKLWKKIKQQETHLHYFPTFTALTVKVEQALIKFANAPREILAL